MERRRATPPSEAVSDADACWEKAEDVRPRSTGFVGDESEDKRLQRRSLKGRQLRTWSKGWNGRAVWWCGLGGGGGRECLLSIPADIGIHCRTLGSLRVGNRAGRI